MVSLVPSVVAPAIYTFNFPDEPMRLRDAKRNSTEQHPNRWGWHRASELLEAINNLLVLRGCAKMTARDVAEAFPHLSPYREMSELLIVDGGGQSWVTKTGPMEWLEAVLKNDGYLPARIGTRLLKAVQHQKMDAIIKCIAGI